MSADGNEHSSKNESVIVERWIPQPPEHIWRALTTPALVEKWLLKTDIVPIVGRRFTFRSEARPGWSGVMNCEVITVETPRLFIYIWGDGTESDSGLKTLVTWTLTPREGGTLVRMEHSGFRPQDEDGYKVMGNGWLSSFDLLESVVAPG